MKSTTLQSPRTREYATFADDLTMPDNESLVMRWNDLDSYLIEIRLRCPSPPLMGALSLRQETPQPTRPSPPSPLGNTSSSQTTPVHSRGPTWALWRRTRSERDPLNPPPLPCTSPNDQVPSLIAFTSQPIQTPPEVKTELASPSLESYIPKASSPTTSPDLKAHYARTLRLTSEQLKELHLSKDSKRIPFSSASSWVIAWIARIFVGDSSDHVVVSDIDGTIRKSDALGHAFAMIGRGWTDSGATRLCADIAKRYKIMYSMSRAIGWADSTRDDLSGIKQSDYQLPEGPMADPPPSWDFNVSSLYSEVIMRNAKEVEMARLRDIQRVAIPSSQIFMIDSTGDVKTELLELTKLKSSYITMAYLVQQMFPPVNQKLGEDSTDFYYWRAPIEEYELRTLTASADIASNKRRKHHRSPASAQAEVAGWFTDQLALPLQPPRETRKEREEQEFLRSCDYGISRERYRRQPRPL